MPKPKTTTTTTTTEMPTELQADELDGVVGGWSTGVYASVNANTPWSMGGYTAAVGVQTSFPFVTGGVYQTTGSGLSTGVSAGVSAGVFGSTTNADGAFTGAGYQAGLAVEALGKVGVEAGASPGSVSAGVTVGLGIAPIDGVAISGFQTQTTAVTLGGAPPGSTNVPAHTDANGQVVPDR